jgi:hypothetical protein
MTTQDMKAILEELAAGRIDAAEAARRIDALKASQSTPGHPPLTVRRQATIPQLRSPGPQPKSR